MFENVPGSSKVEPPGEQSKPEKDWGPWKPVGQPGYNPPDTKSEISSVLSKYTGEREGGASPTDGRGRKIAVIVAVLLVLGGVAIGVNATLKRNREKAANANANVNAAAAANVNATNVNTSTVFPEFENAGGNSNVNAQALCSSENFQCSLISTTTNERDPKYVDVNILGTTDPSITTVAGEVGQMKIGGKEVAQCIFGVEIDQPGGKYIGCTVPKADYSPGSSAEVLLPLSTGSENIQFSLPRITENVNANGNTNTATNVNAVVNTNVVEDPDRDGLTDEQEAIYKTDPRNPDTDGDGFSDGVEVQNGFNPKGEGRL